MIKCKRKKVPKKTEDLFFLIFIFIYFFIFLFFACHYRKSLKVNLGLANWKFSKIMAGKVTLPPRKIFLLRPLVHTPLCLYPTMSLDVLV